MLTPELAQQLTSVADQLIAIATGEAPGGTEPAGAPPGYVAVRPTGARGGAIVRYWPAPQPEAGENAWGYVIRCSRTKDPLTGLYHYPPQAIGAYGMMASAMPADMPWPEQADRIAYRSDWLTQAEIDREEEAARQWGAWTQKVNP